MPSWKYYRSPFTEIETRLSEPKQIVSSTEIRGQAPVKF